MLVGTHAGGEDLRNIRIGNHGEAVVDGSGGGRVFFCVHFAKGQHEGENAVLVVFEIALVVSGFDGAERQRRPAGETQGVDQCRDILAEGHQTRFPTELHAFLGELLGELLAAGSPRGTAHKHVDVLLLQFAGDLHGDGVGGGRTR